VMSRHGERNKQEKIRKEYIFMQIENGVENDNNQ